MQSNSSTVMSTSSTETTPAATTSGKATPSETTSSASSSKSENTTGVDANTEEGITSEEENDKAPGEGKEKWVAIKNVSMTMAMATPAATTPVTSTTKAASWIAWWSHVSGWDKSIFHLPQTAFPIP